MAPEEQRIIDAQGRLMEVLAAEHALVKPEAIARLSEAYYGSDSRNFDSHIVGQALQALERAGDIVVRTAGSKGGHQITTYEPADQRLRKTAVTDALMRKRALYARYLSWAHGSIRYPQGFLGPAGEAAVRGGILESAALQPAEPGAGPVSSILGVRLPGPADSAGYMNTLLEGMPQPPVTLLFEVKNIREWIYPSASELFQVLHKAVILQQARPTTPIVPIFICRAAQKTAFYMASQLGFLIIDLGIQYVGHQVEEPAFNEVRNELHFNDLHLGEHNSLRVRDRLKQHVPGIAHRYANQWNATALDPEIAPILIQLRSSRLSSMERSDLMTTLRELNINRGQAGGW